MGNDGAGNPPELAGAAATSAATLAQALVDATVRGGFAPIGQSRQGRAIVARRFAAGGRASSTTVEGIGGVRPARTLLLLGGIHGDEPASVEALLELARSLSAPAGAPAHPDILMIPALNPDGLAAGQKNAASDVDLNRNFPARNFSVAHAPGYCPGAAPLSEPETALLADLIDSRAIDAVVSVHAPFACVNFDGPAASWAGVVAAASGWPVRENIGYPTPGSLGSWLGGDRHLPILTLELPAGPLAGFRAAARAALESACAATAGGRPEDGAK